MRRPLGVSIIAILNLLTGLSYFAILAAMLFALFFGEHGDVPLEYRDYIRALLPLGFLGLGTAASLAAGHGLWRMKEWGRQLGFAVGSLTILGFFLSFLKNMRRAYSHMMGPWHLLETLLTHAYFFVLWPVREVATHFFPGFAFEADFVARYSMGIVVNALVVRYLLSGRSKQAFSASS